MSIILEALELIRSLALGSNNTPSVLPRVDSLIARIRSEMEAEQAQVDADLAAERALFPSPPVFKFELVDTTTDSK